ncbi:MAG: hypothetical protein IT162_19570 [Bryobacterales bacterium]|nr:hypothetical protein [Bryobacterales bacterium]
MPHLLLLLVLSAAAALGASRDWSAVQSLRAGQPVEVSYARSHAAGELVSVAADQMVIRTKTGEVTAARVDVKRVWTPAHRRGRNAAIGAAIGLGAGLAPGLVFRAYANNEIGGGSKFLAGTLAVTGGIGAGLGALSRGRDLVYKRP